MSPLGLSALHFPGWKFKLKVSWGGNILLEKYWLIIKLIINNINCRCQHPAFPLWLFSGKCGCNLSRKTHMKFLLWIQMQKDWLEEAPLIPKNDVDKCVPTDTWKRCHKAIPFTLPTFTSFRKGPVCTHNCSLVTWKSFTKLIVQWVGNGILSVLPQEISSHRIIESQIISCWKASMWIQTMGSMCSIWDKSELTAAIHDFGLGQAKKNLIEGFEECHHSGPWLPRIGKPWLEGRSTTRR